MIRMIITGNSGSGKAWLAGRLVDPTGGPVIYLDHIFWEPGVFEQTKNAADYVLQQ
ncbi:hypothetical protein DSCO28_69820 [Desulfosarcina ovata subsp. sediminis]|uniref:Uncharacterized protein n=1 Tax=Desulfosarcina ovata subsp. sediminis TaxID=885957 RepID=A0A5K8A1U7_9BACT|nr:hypothetical protein DSCO28_69820 [Desulfosarcina ovata subsp. sediminis]